MLRKVNVWNGTNPNSIISDRTNADKLAPDENVDAQKIVKNDDHWEYFSCSSFGTSQQWNTNTWHLMQAEPQAWPPLKNSEEVFVQVILRVFRPKLDKTWTGMQLINNWWLCLKMYFEDL